jgi:hypothetical protein
MAGTGRAAAGLALVAVLALGATGCDGGKGEDKAGALSLFNLRTGDCFDSPAGRAGTEIQVDKLETVACTGAHDGEVFAVLTHPDPPAAPWPGDIALSQFADSRCVDAFGAYAGVAYGDSDLQVATVRPSQESWVKKHDREIGCVLYRQEGRLNGSQRKAG